MQKSPAIGHGCSCLGQAAVAATKSEKKRYSSTLECEIRANIAKLSVKPFLFLSHRYIYLSLFLSLLISLHFPRIVRDSRLRTDVQPRANKSAGFVEAARKKENDIRIRRQRIPRPREFSFQSARARISLWCANATGGKKEESRGRQPGKTGGFMNRSVPLATFPPHRFQIRIVERRSVAEDNSFECVPHIRNGTTFIPLCPDSSSLRRNPSREHYPINFSAYAA